MTAVPATPAQPQRQAPAALADRLPGAGMFELFRKQ